MNEITVYTAQTILASNGPEHLWRFSTTFASMEDARSSLGAGKFVLLEPRGKEAGDGIPPRLEVTTRLVVDADKNGNRRVREVKEHTLD